MNELGRTKRALEVAIVAMNKAYNLATHQWLALELHNINRILNPPQEMETVEVKKWLVINEHGDAICAYQDSGQPRDHYPHPQYQVVEVNGTFQRPKPRPVERSVNVEAHVVDGTGAFMAGSILSMDNCPLLESFTECHGKTGTLTFTWQE